MNPRKAQAVFAAMSGVAREGRFAWALFGGQAAKLFVKVSPTVDIDLAVQIPVNRRVMLMDLLERHGFKKVDYGPIPCMVTAALHGQPVDLILALKFDNLLVLGIDEAKRMTVCGRKIRVIRPEILALQKWMSSFAVGRGGKALIDRRTAQRLAERMDFDWGYIRGVAEQTDNTDEMGDFSKWCAKRRGGSDVR